MIGVDREGRFQLIPVGRIVPAARSVRARPAPEELEILADSIRRHGVLQPILVRRGARDFEVVVGVRRLLAARIAGLGEIPAIVRDLDDREAFEIAVSENATHKPFGPEERQRAKQELARLFPTRSDRELESWLGTPAPGGPASGAFAKTSETVLPDWMDDSFAEKPATSIPEKLETADTDVTKRYWLEDVVAKAPAPEEKRAKRTAKLLPRVKIFLQEFTQSGAIDLRRLEGITSELFHSAASDPPHSFLDLTYREPARKYLPRHCLNVAKLALFLGKAHDLRRSELEELTLCGLLHDVGMFQVDEAVFKKRAQLSDDEWRQVRSHPLEGSVLLTKEALLRDVVARVALEHHERPDGTGYPHGKKKEELHLYARLINVVDTYEAMVSPRAHRLPVLPHEAMQRVMDEGARGMLDWELVELFAKSMGLYPIGSYLKLLTGEIARVVRANPETPARPVVQIIADAARTMLKRPVLVDLAPQDPPIPFEPIPRPM